MAGLTTSTIRRGPEGFALGVPPRYIDAIRACMVATEALDMRAGMCVDMRMGMCVDMRSRSAAQRLRALADVAFFIFSLADVAFSGTGMSIPDQ